MEIKVGFFILFLSLATNIFVAVMAMLCTAAIRTGVGIKDYGWIRWVARICMLGCALGVFLYSLAFQFYISKTILEDGYKTAVWTISCLLGSTTLIFMAFTVRRG